MLAEFARPAGCTRVGGKPRKALGELEGRADLITGISFWVHKKPTEDRPQVDWVVKRATRAATIELPAWHERTGRVISSAALA